VQRTTDAAPAHERQYFFFSCAATPCSLAVPPRRRRFACRRVAAPAAVLALPPRPPTSTPSTTDWMESRKAATSSSRQRSAASTTRARLSPSSTPAAAARRASSRNDSRSRLTCGRAVGAGWRVGGLGQGASGAPPSSAEGRQQAQQGPRAGPEQRLGVGHTTALGAPSPEAWRSGSCGGACPCRPWWVRGRRRG
jgi:hypothetical protein